MLRFLTDFTATEINLNYKLSRQNITQIVLQLSSEEWKNRNKSLLRSYFEERQPTLHVHWIHSFLNEPFLQERRDS